MAVLDLEAYMQFQPAYAGAVANEICLHKETTSWLFILEKDNSNCDLSSKRARLLSFDFICYRSSCVYPLVKHTSGINI